MLALRLFLSSSWDSGIYLFEQASEYHIIAWMTGIFFICINPTETKIRWDSGGASVRFGCSICFFLELVRLRFVLYANFPFPVLSLSRLTFVSYWYHRMGGGGIEIGWQSFVVEKFGLDLGWNLWTLNLGSLGFGNLIRGRIPFFPCTLRYF